MKDQQVLNLGLEDPPTEIGVQIEFPESYSEDDMEAVWAAVLKVQKERNLP